MKIYQALIYASLIATFSVHTNATTITFGPGSYGTPVGATNEGIYTYDTFSGALFRDSQGNGDSFNMEGLAGTGGVLSLARNDVLNGLFTFDGADVAWQFNISDSVIFEGFLSGVSQGIDSFLTSADSAYTSYLSNNLSGVFIDTLFVTLNAPTTSQASVVDNIVLTEVASVPEPSTIALFGLGLLGFGLARRKKHN
ncbi:PEP-CTERM sorting domain-containing protein [Marinobacter similis]|nr:PEP-CTERM sorting domain-containing protein [Marinobacter similis]